MRCSRHSGEKRNGSLSIVHRSNTGSFPLLPTLPDRRHRHWQTIWYRQITTTTTVAGVVVVVVVVVVIDRGGGVAGVGGRYDGAIFEHGSTNQIMQSLFTPTYVMPRVREKVREKRCRVG